VDFELNEEQKMIRAAYLGEDPGDLSSL